MKKVLKTLETFATRRLVLTFDKVDFTYTHLSWKRLSNWFLTELSYVLRSDRAWAYPTHLQIEPSNKCNLRCPLCHVVTDNKPRGFLKLDDFKKLIDEVEITFGFTLNHTHKSRLYSVRRRVYNDRNKLLKSGKTEA